jgi:hypothetical protein
MGAVKTPVPRNCSFLKEVAIRAEMWFWAIWQNVVTSSLATGCLL